MRAIDSTYFQALIRLFGLDPCICLLPLFSLPWNTIIPYDSVRWRHPSKFWFFLSKVFSRKSTIFSKPKLTGIQPLLSMTWVSILPKLLVGMKRWVLVWLGIAFIKVDPPRPPIINLLLHSRRGYLRAKRCITWYIYPSFNRNEKKYFFDLFSIAISLLRCPTVTCSVPHSHGVPLSLFEFPTAASMLKFNTDLVSAV